MKGKRRHMTDDYGRGIVPDPVEDHNLAKAMKATSQADKLMAAGEFRPAQGTIANHIPVGDAIGASVPFPGPFPGTLPGGPIGPVFPGPFPGGPLPFPPGAILGPGEAQPVVTAAPTVTVKVEEGLEDTIIIVIKNPPNPQARRVVERVIPKALELYLNKSRDYGGNVMDRFGLGPKACIPDMSRKFGKLIDAIWFGKTLKYEQPEEVMEDLLGHLFITLDEVQQGS